MCIYICGSSKDGGCCLLEEDEVEDFFFFDLDFLADTTQNSEPDLC